MDSVELIHQSFQKKFEVIYRIGTILYDICKDEIIKENIRKINDATISIHSDYDMLVLSNSPSLYSGVKLEDTDRYIAIIKSSNFQGKITNIMNDLQILSNDMNITDESSKELEASLKEYNLLSTSNNGYEFSYETCNNCKKTMTEDEDSGDLICENCGFMKKVHGANSFKYDKTKNMHNVAKYVDEWIRKIEGKPSRKIPKEIVDLVKKRCIETELFKPSYEDIRAVLKYLGKTQYNHFCPYIRWQITEVKPEQFTTDEKTEIKSRFITAIDIYMQVKPDTRTNKPHYPYFIFKLVDLLLPNSERKFRIMDAIHIQERKTIVKNDIYWEKVCHEMKDSKIYYKPTDRFYRDNAIINMNARKNA